MSLTENMKAIREAEVKASMPYLKAIRDAEIEILLPDLQPKGASILEIGAGTGEQAKALAARGYRLTAIEIPDSNYAQERIYPIVDYDGAHIPFPNGSFDIVFSSNVMEHVPDLPHLHAEIRRVLKPEGYCLHVLPTHVWRFWTTLAAWPNALRALILIARGEYATNGFLHGMRAIALAILQRRHGERGNVITEFWYFRPAWWRRNFRENGFNLIEDRPMGLFYTGWLVFRGAWTIEKRQRVARALGSACHMYKLRLPDVQPGPSVRRIVPRNLA